MEIIHPGRGFRGQTYESLQPISYIRLSQSGKWTNIDRDESTEELEGDSLLTQESSNCAQPDADMHEEDPRRYMTPGGVLEDMFRGLSSKTPDPVAIKEVRGFLRTTTLLICN